MSDQLLDGVAQATSHRDRHELDREVTRLLLGFLNAETVTLLRLVDDESSRQMLRRVCLASSRTETTAAETAPPSWPVTENAAWHECIVKGEIQHSQDAQQHAITLVPIRGEHDVNGLLVIETFAALGKRETDLIAGILSIIRNHLALLDYGELDTLTGLLNRKTFERSFEKVRRLNRAQQPIPPTGEAGAPEAPQQDPGQQESSWLALIDVDHFKSVNDGYGHLFGDEVLLLVSRLMKRSFRGADQLFRFGGEEFVVVLERTNEHGATIALERLRSAVAEYPFPQIGKVTISTGFTRVVPSDVSTTCVERADEALYYAKNHGRNRVQNWEALVASGEITAKSSDGDVELFDE
jgi:diguanylate cyclase (GGDEF)-like protein